MKHIRKRFLFEKKLPAEIADCFIKQTAFIEYNATAKLEVPDDKTAYLFTEDNRVIRPFQFKDKDRVYYIPVPDPILVYFNTAYFNFKNIESAKTKVFQVLEETVLSEAIINDLYHFFSLSNVFVVSLISALEAFVNEEIPANFEYSVQYKKRRKVLNKAKIQRNVPFLEKVNKVMREISKKHFAKEHPEQYKLIEELKEFRDSLVHMKPEAIKTENDFVYIQALSFRYEETLEAVAAYMNYYKQDYIVECPCGLEL